MVGAWQDWDADAGGWWSLNALTFGPPLVTLDTYAAANPGARLAQSALGAVRVVVGCGGAAWAGFVGNADAFTIDVNGNSMTYNFEVTAPPPPPVTPANKDACKKDGWKTLQRADGSTFKNQGDCIQYVNTGM